MREGAKLGGKGLWLALLGLGSFWLSVMHLPSAGKQTVAGGGEVVLPAALQLVLYGGDRYLAADVESTRVMTSGRLTEQADLDFYVRLHRTVAVLNPCHEDSLYTAAAFLASGGAVRPATEILEKAMACRYWDAWAAFHLGVNYHFFAHDNPAAVRALDIAAQRTSNSQERTLFQGIAISLKARDFDDANAAVRYLQSEQKRIKDARLKESLEKRIVRLQGLARLNDAQKRFEARFDRPLTKPEELLTTGMLTSFPDDPLKIGYQFRDGQFQLRDLGPQ